MSIDWSLKETAAARLAQDLDVERQIALAEVMAWANDFAVEVTGSIIETEPASWEFKERAARAVVATPSTASPEQAAVLAAEVSETGETVAELAAFVIARADRFRAVQARLTGLRRRAQMAFEEALTVSEVATRKAAILADAEIFAAAVRSES